MEKLKYCKINHHTISKQLFSFGCLIFDHMVRYPCLGSFTNQNQPKSVKTSHRGMRNGSMHLKLISSLIR